MDTGNIKHLSALQNLTIRFGDKTHELFLLAMENRLMEMSDAAKNNEEQWRLLQLSRELRRQKAVLLMAFKRYLSDGFQAFQRDRLGGKDTTRQDMSRDLSLMADDELEQDLATSSLARRADTRFSEELFALNQRMAMLKGGHKLADDGNPLGAYQFAGALQTEITILKLDTRFTVLFFRVFEKVLLENLGDLYKAANDYLIKQGILPNLRYGTAVAGARAQQKTSGGQQEEKAKPVKTTNTDIAKRIELEAAQDPAQLESNAAQRQLYAEISGLQGAAAVAGSQQLPEGSPSAAGSPAPAGVPAGSYPPSQYQPHFFSQPAFAAHGNAAVAMCSQNEVVTALARVPLERHAEVMEQSVVPPAMTVEQFQGVTQQLREQIGDDKQIADDDGRTIDLVGMIFEYMLGDKQLPDSVKAVLSYLHTPYLKAAFIDRKLFEKPEHSSRQLLNCLAEAGTRWVNTDGDSQFKVFPKIKSVIRRVLTDFHSDIGLFDELLMEMREFNHKVERSIEVMERRAREKAEGEDRLREVKRRVLMEVRKRMDGHDLPSHIIVLLLHPWSDYLTFTLLRHGEDSSQWQEGIDTIDEIVWSVQEKPDINERNRLMLIQESLQSRVQAGLETIAHDQAKSNKLLDALSKSQMLVLQNLVAEPATAEKRAEMEAEASADLDEESIDLASLSPDEKDMMDTLSHVAFGTWIEFDRLDNFENLRARIAWFNAKTSHYMLVDRSGKQVAMKSGLEISRMILSSQARMLADSGKPFFERALENVFARLKAAMSH
jgi:hypothetical protein